MTPIKGIEIYGTYAEAYRAPAITETLISGVHPGFPFEFLPNPDLKPETARNSEIGVNVQYNSVLLPGDAFRAKADYFHNNVDNYIDQFFDVNKSRVSIRRSELSEHRTGRARWCRNRGDLRLGERLYDPIRGPHSRMECRYRHSATYGSSRPHRFDDRVEVLR